MLKKIIRVLSVAVLLLIIPIMASYFVDGWGWSRGDYAFAFIMFAGTGLLFEIGRSISSSATYRIAFGMALAGGFMLIWVTGAVGIIGSEDNPINLMYLAVLAFAFLGSIVARFQARGMTRIMFLSAFAIALIPVIALIMKSSFAEHPEAVGVLGIFVLNAFFVILFIGAGLLFKQAGETKQVTK
jgi:hypothetical protein